MEFSRQFLLQGIFPTQGSNPGLLHCRQTLYHLSHQGSPITGFSSVQFSRSVVSDSLQPMNCSTPGLPVHHQLPELTQTHVHRVGDAILPPIPPSIRVYSNESTLCMMWPKYWSFSFSISPSKEIPGLIFRMDWLDLLAVQGTLKSLLQHHGSKRSILRCSAFFTVQLSHPYMTTGKTIALTSRTLVSKVMSLLLNILSRLVITFLPRSKRLLIQNQNSYICCL